MPPAMKLSVIRDFLTNKHIFASIFSFHCLTHCITRVPTRSFQKVRHRFVNFSGYGMDRKRDSFGDKLAILFDETDSFPVADSD
jgi:hypothetical protein